MTWPLRGAPVTARPWRVGRKLGRTIYAQIAAEPSDNDVLIGVMDDARYAAEVVRLHNDSLHLEDAR